jgi:hypothetical protein
MIKYNKINTRLGDACLKRSSKKRQNNRESGGGGTHRGSDRSGMQKPLTASGPQVRGISTERNRPSC